MYLLQILIKLNQFVNMIHMHTLWLQLGGSFLYEPEDMVCEVEMVDSGREGGEKEESARCKLSCIAQKTLRRIFEDIVSKYPVM